jgi:TPP-dependent indolepyruvate ferredoxin oxidoreductase alpha subunit
LNYLQSPGLISRDAPETLVSLTGDGTIAQRLLEAGIRVLTSYLDPVAEKFSIYVEWSINEKMAFEVAVAGAIAGVRTCFQGKDSGQGRDRKGVGGRWVGAKRLGKAFAVNPRT